MFKAAPRSALDAPAVHTPASPAVDFSLLSVEEKVELYRQELEREEKAGGKSAVS